MNVVLVPVAGWRDVAWVASGQPEQPRRLDVAEGRLDHFRGRVQPLEAAHHRRRLGEVALRHDERVGDRRLLQRLVAAKPWTASTVATTVSSA